MRARPETLSVNSHCHDSMHTRHLPYAPVTLACLSHTLTILRAPDLPSSTHNSRTPAPPPQHPDRPDADRPPCAPRRQGEHRGHCAVRVLRLRLHPFILCGSAVCRGLQEGPGRNHKGTGHLLTSGCRAAGITKTAPGVASLFAESESPGLVLSAGEQLALQSMAAGWRLPCMQPESLRIRCQER